MIRNFYIVRGFIPEDVEARNEGWLRLVEARTPADQNDYSFTPYQNVDVTVTEVGYDHSEVRRHPFNGDTIGETKVTFAGQVALEGSTEEMEGFYYRSGHPFRVGQLSVLTAAELLTVPAEG